MKVRYSFSSRRTGVIENTNKHRKPFPALAKEVIRISDVILYILDARYISETRNREFEEIIKDKNKIVITVLNKCDLVNVAQLRESKEIEGLKPYVLFSCTTHLGRRNLRDQIKIAVKRLRNANALYEGESDEKVYKLSKIKWAVGKTQWLKLSKKAHVGVIGYPNTGKSSVINLLTNRNAAKTSAEAGFTRGIQKIKFSKDILILDTPGVIGESPNKKSNEEETHAKIGARTYHSAKNPEVIVSNLLETHAKQICSFYGLGFADDADVLIEELGRKRGYLSKGNIVDTDRTARLVLKDWQSGKIAKKK
ncbi:hypothetical protein CO038_00685 [Candidatus Pacearchaeota archaeon CG_4_9_14_0_2_um_filter_39_13]|nr:MAG: hypothetical protein AUJ64_01850 [Candidatus Pacearchaeota archaeon CG1_02_39_14]PJC45024.1 MAG: hypothetical protein CO038_00685 [Candidatus Pacearchaeota archaeon CG_4_9_14_0_2_um_filter_39_13]